MKLKKKEKKRKEKSSWSFPLFVKEFWLVGGGVVFSLNKMSLLHAYEHEIFAAGTDAFFRAIGFLNRF